MSHVEKILREAHDATLDAWYEKLSENFLRILKILVSLVLAAYLINFLVIPLLAEAGWWKPSWYIGKGSHETWGQFGDYVGGILNPLIAAGALFWLIQSVGIQRTELRESRKALYETAEAQKLQVIETKRTAQINALNVSITASTADIEALRSDLSFLLNQLVDGKGDALSFDTNGAPILVQRMTEKIRKLRAEIHGLQELRKIQLQHLDKLTKDLYPA